MCAREFNHYSSAKPAHYRPVDQQINQTQT